MLRQGVWAIPEASIPKSIADPRWPDSTQGRQIGTHGLMELTTTRYGNIQGLRAIAALMVVSCHVFQDIAPMRTHWAKPFFVTVGAAGVDLFFVISGFIIYHVAQRSIAGMDVVGKGRTVYAFAMKRFIRIYPLYWIVFATSSLVMSWAPPPASPHESLLQLLALIDDVPNFRVYVAWTLTFEVYFYAVAGLSLLLLARRAMAGVTTWFTMVACATLL